MQGGPAHNFLAAPSSLFLLLFKLVTISMRASFEVVAAGLLLAFFLILVTGSTGCSTIWDGIDAITDFGIYGGDLAGDS